MHAQKSVSEAEGSAKVGGANYAYDKPANRTSRADLFRNTTLNFSYDAIYELMQAVQGTTTKESYTYDAVGNRTSSLGVSPYSYNSSNELTSIPGATYTYDNNGNLLTKVAGSSTTSFAWDFENRLTSVTLPGSGGTVTFKYDPFGRRIQKISSLGTSIYVYDGDNQIEEVDASGAQVARYTQGLGVDEPLSMFRGGVTNYYHADGLGSILGTSVVNGTYSELYQYDSFGKLLSSDGRVTNWFQYTARERDDETGLYYYRARYYDPSVGRFISEDRLGFSEAINFYSYILNDPLNLVDPSGMSACCPSQEDQSIRERIVGVRKQITALEVTGEVLLTETTNPLLRTFCVGAGIVGHPEIPFQTFSFTDVLDPTFKQRQPCIYKCAQAHEAVHRRMCRRIGFQRYWALTTSQKELPGYTTELGCLIKLLQDGGLSTIF